MPIKKAFPYIKSALRIYKPEDFLPLCAPSKKLRSDNQMYSRIRSVCYWLLVLHRAKVFKKE
jgi:hypothetical protein